MTLLKRIANYFCEWDGDDNNAPKMKIGIDDLRYIADLNVQRCRLEKENKMLREKQIPKKIIKLKKIYYGTPYMCPICQADQTRTEFIRDDGCYQEEKYSYCWSCGQRLDWSEEE